MLSLIGNSVSDKSVRLYGNRGWALIVNSLKSGGTMVKDEMWVKTFWGEVAARAPRAHKT